MEGGGRMAGKVLSPRKRTTSAGTRSRSTTSSTIGSHPSRKTVPSGDSAVMHDEVPPQPLAIPVPPEDAEMFTTAQQDEFLQWFTRGAPPAMACQQLGVSI